MHDPFHKRDAKLNKKYFESNSKRIKDWALDSELGPTQLRIRHCYLITAKYRKKLIEVVLIGGGVAADYSRMMSAESTQQYHECTSSAGQCLCLELCK